MFEVEGETVAAHRLILAALVLGDNAQRCTPQRLGAPGERVRVEDVRAPVFRALLHFAYADDLPEELRGAAFDVPAAQHLLAAADRFQLPLLRSRCEQRLCETVGVDTVATTLALADQNNAAQLKHVCLEFVAKNLRAVMATPGYRYMTYTCPSLQAELLGVIAAGAEPEAGGWGAREPRSADGVPLLEGPGANAVALHHDAASGHLGAEEEDWSALAQRTGGDGPASAREGAAGGPTPPRRVRQRRD